MIEIVALTQNAQTQAKLLLDKEDSNSKEGLRIAVIGGGCAGLTYKIGWDTPAESDMVYEYTNGLKVFIDDKSAIQLAGSTMEFYNALERSGFQINNPNAKNGCCGCGKSFSM